MGFFSKIKEGLSKTKQNISDGLNELFSNFRKVDEEFLEELEEILLLADVGFETSEKIIEELRHVAKLEKIENAEVLKTRLSDILTEMMSGGNELKINTKPSVIIVVGVNGVGKTTTIGKLANMLKNDGKNVLIAAADTFRAAAVEQIEIWAQRADIDIVKHSDGSDPASVVYDAICAAKSRGTDVIICDTAGRLHNKKNLMDELTKISKIAERELPGCDRETLLVVDATTGQNAVEQAKNFKNATDVTGVVLTKLDSTAKGGVTIAVKEVTGVPVKLVGLGEQIDDLKVFDPEDFAKALIG